MDKREFRSRTCQHLCDAICRHRQFHRHICGTAHADRKYRNDLPPSLGGYHRDEIAEMNAVLSQFLCKAARLACELTEGEAPICGHYS